MNNLRSLFESEIKTFVREYQVRKKTKTRFGDPITGFADACCDEILMLPSLIGPDHILPQDVLPDATVIISYYVPFTKDLARTNAPSPDRAAEIASPEWACAYEELNALFTELNAHLADLISNIKPAGCCDGEHSSGCCGGEHSSGFCGVVPKAASEFDQEALISNWSQRHIAYAAGLGTFGLNNMLITPAGCCGRFNSIITNISRELLPPSEPMHEEMCLYKRAKAADSDGPDICRVCVRNCPAGALGGEIYQRKDCYRVCLKNAALYPVSDIAGDRGDSACGDAACGGAVCGGAASYSGSVGSEVCGKCITQSPCAFLNRAE